MPGRKLNLAAISKYHGPIFKTSKMILRWSEWSSLYISNKFLNIRYRFRICCFTVTILCNGKYTYSVFQLMNDSQEPFFPYIKSITYFRWRNLTKYLKRSTLVKVTLQFLTKLVVEGNFLFFVLQQVFQYTFSFMILALEYFVYVAVLYQL